MLELIEGFETRERVYRVTLNPGRRRLIDKIRAELSDEREITEALAFLGEPAELDATTLTDLLQIPFTRKPFPRDQRFSNGEFGVLYTAHTAETAGREYAHWAPRNFVPQPGAPVRVRLHLISCFLQGRVKDVRPYLNEWPWLIWDDYSECQKLGAAAVAEGLAALIAPSARDRVDGTTLPIFLINAASQPEVEGDVIFLVSATEPTSFQIRREHRTGTEEG